MISIEELEEIVNEPYPDISSCKDCQHCKKEYVGSPIGRHIFHRDVFLCKKRPPERSLIIDFEEECENCSNRHAKYNYKKEAYRTTLKLRVLDEAIDSVSLDDRSELQRIKRELLSLEAMMVFTKYHPTWVTLINEKIYTKIAWRLHDLGVLE